MECKRCGNEIQEGDKFCNKCGKKVKDRKIIILLILAIIIIFSIVLFLIIHNNNKNNLNNDTQSNINLSTLDDSKNTSAEKIIYKALYEFCNEYDIEFNPSEDQMQELIALYNKNPNNFNQETLSEFLFTGDWLVRGVYNDETDVENKNIEATIMPNLVGMEYGDLRQYLDDNNLSYIKNIKYITDKKISYSKVYPYKVLSTIPAAGEELNPSTDTSITVYTNEISPVESVEIYYKNEDDWHSKYFGKNIKVQVGSDENSFIEGVIEKNFCLAKTTGEQYIKYDAYGTYKNYTEALNMVKKHKIAYLLPDDMQEGIGRYNRTATLVKIKIYIDDTLIKEVNAEYTGVGINIEI